MKKYLYTALALLASCLPAFGATVTANSGQSLATIQATENALNVGDTLSFSAGTYNWGGFLTVKWGVTVTGPSVNPATAIINETTTNSFAMAITPGTTGTTTITNFQFHTAGIYVGNASWTGLTLTNNQFTNLQSSVGGTANSSAAVYLDGSLLTTTTNFTAQFNTFGDVNSCTAVFATVSDEGGYCAGIYHSGGIAVNHNISFNTFNHVEEGAHYHQICSGCATGTNVSVTNGLKVQYNYFVNWTRIALEIQSQLVGNGQNISHNYAVNPINPSWKTMFLSLACCTGGRTAGTSTPPNPANQTYDNVLLVDNAHLQTVGTFHAPVIGIEFWGGNGSFADWNYIGGGGSNGINWGFNGQPFYARNNYVCQSYGGLYITEEENQGTLTQVNNTFSATCATRATTAPTISQSATQVTLTDAGIPIGTGMLDAQPISIFYTTDGSTPTVASTLYTAPFSPTTGATVKAIGMWGVAPMPTSQIAGYGYVPSSVVSATFNGAGTNPTLISIALPADTTSVVAGTAATQLAALGNMSSGPQQTITGSTGFTTTSASTICTVSASGIFLPVGAGNCAVIATNGAAIGGANITVTTPSATTSSLNTTPAANVTTLIVGQTVQMKFTQNYSNGTSSTIAATSYAMTSGGTVCSVTSPAGLITALTAGTCVVQANGSSTTWTFAVTAATLADISISGTSNTMVQGATQTLSATGIYSSGPQQAVTPGGWATSNAAIALVDGSGNVTAVAPGIATITAALGAVTSSHSFSITVSPNATPPPSVTLNSASILAIPTKIYVGQQLQLSLQGTFSDGTTGSVTPDSAWTTSNTALALVDPSSGLFTALAPGTVSVAGSSGGLPSSPQTFTISPYPFAFSMVIPVPFGGPFAGPLLQSQILAPGVYTVTVTSGGTTITTTH